MLLEDWAHGEVVPRDHKVIKLEGQRVWAGSHLGQHELLPLLFRRHPLDLAVAVAVRAAVRVKI